MATTELQAASIAAIRKDRDTRVEGTAFIVFVGADLIGVERLVWDLGLVAFRKIRLNCEKYPRFQGHKIIPHPLLLSIVLIASLYLIQRSTVPPHAECVPQAGARGGGD